MSHKESAVIHRTKINNKKLMRKKKETKSERKKLTNK